MKGDVPAAIALHDLNPKLLELFFGCDEIPIHSRPPTESNNRRMLDQEQSFAVPLQHALVNVLLVFPGGAVSELA